MLPKHLFHLFVLILMHILASIHCAKILAIAPFPGPSQYLSIRTLLKALAERGHELTVVSHFPQKKKLQNFRDIALKKNEYNEVFIQSIMHNDGQQKYTQWTNFYRNATLSVLENEEVQHLLFVKKEHFDLVITEIVLTEALYAIATHLNAHLIGFCSGGTDEGIDQWTGNPSPLSYAPSILKPYTDKMDFWQRMDNFKDAIFTWYFINFPHLDDQREIYKKYFPHLAYELEEISKNFSLVLLNQHFTLTFPRPYIPHLIEVGGMYLEDKPAMLPKEIQNFIDQSEHDVIYFSLGSNAKSTNLEKEKLEAILKVLRSLKEHVLWKFENPDLIGNLSNVMIQNWLPQADILAHPKVKLFITHGGQLSTIEAVSHAKPILGIPLFYDQFQNMAQAKQKGFGIDIAYKDLKEELFRKAILELLQNDSYTKAVKVISKRFRDQPIRPLDLAIYWTEYILRHDGAPFMRVEGRNLNLFQYFCLDVISFILLGVLLSLILLIVLLRLALQQARKIFTRSFKNKTE